MSKQTKKHPFGIELFWGSGLALGLYLTGLMLLTLFAVRGGISDTFPAVAVLCFASSLVGGLTVARRLPWGTLPSALLVSACFTGTLVLVGLSFPSGLTLTGKGGGLLLCALSGGIAAGLLSSRKKVRRKHG